MGRVALVAFKILGQRLAFLEGDQRQQHVARQRQIQRGVGLAVTVPVFLLGAGVAFVVVAVRHRPVPAHRARRALLLAHGQAGEEVAGGAFPRLARGFLLRPVALDRDGTAGSRPSGVDLGDGGDGSAAQVQPPVFAFLAQFKRGRPGGRASRPPGVGRCWPWCR